MLQGLYTMGAAELGEIAKMAGVQAGAEEDVTRAKILQWLGKISGAANDEE